MLRAAEVTVDRADKPDAPNFAGLIAVLRLQSSNGTIQRYLSGTEWKTTRIAPANWFAKIIDDSKWQQAAVVAKTGREPVALPSF